MGCGYLAWNHARGIREARDRAREAPASRSASVAPPGSRGRRNASSPRFLARNRSSRRTCHECSCYKVSGSIRFSTSEPCAAASSFTRCLRAWRGIGRGGGGCCSLSRGWTHLGNSVRGVCRYYAPLRWVRKWDHGIHCITKFFVVRIASRVCATCCCNFHASLLSKTRHQAHGCEQSACMLLDLFRIDLRPQQGCVAAVDRQGPGGQNNQGLEPRSRDAPEAWKPRLC